MAAIFETEVCSRCGGTGEYSYCQSHGTTCFKCKGKKYTLTKRGEEAQRYYIELQLKPVSEVKKGEIISLMGHKGKVIEVNKVLMESSTLVNGEWIKNNPERIEIKLSGISLNTFPSDKVRTYDNVEQAKQKALAYQETLNKAGKVRC